MSPLYIGSGSFQKLSQRNDNTTARGVAPPLHIGILSIKYEQVRLTEYVLDSLPGAWPRRAGRRSLGDIYYLVHPASSRIDDRIRQIIVCYYSELQVTAFETQKWFRLNSIPNSELRRSKRKKWMDTLVWNTQQLCAHSSFSTRKGLATPARA